MPKNSSRTPSDSVPGQSPFEIRWNRVYQRTKTDMKRLRAYGLPVDTTVFRIVQGNREKAILYGDVDRLERDGRGVLVDLVREVIEGRPPKDYSPIRPILTSPSLFFLRTRGRLKRIEKEERKGPMTAEEIGNRMTVIGANARPSQEAIELVAGLLLDMAEREREQSPEMQ